MFSNLRSRPLLVPCSAHYRKFQTSASTEWSFPVPVHFGAGRFESLPNLVKRQGASRPLLVTDRGLAGTDMITGAMCNLRRAGLEPALFGEVDANPTDLNIVSGAEIFRSHGADLIIAVGGGSGLDGGKAIAMVARSNLDVPAFEWTSPPPEVAPGVIPPIIAVPTTAGTGAEMDSASMYTDTTEKIKRCVMHPDCRISVIADPLLTLTLPANLTAWTGMDALTHALEAYFVDSYHPMCDAIALEALRLIDQWLPVAYEDGQNVEARAHMMAASAMAGVAFQKGLGGVHGLSEPIGALHNTQHGLTNAVLLPHVLLRNREAIDRKCSLIVQCLGIPRNGAQSDFDTLLQWVLSLRKDLSIPDSLAELGIDQATAKLCAAKAEANPTGHTNPIRLTAADYEHIVRSSLAGNP